MSKNHVHILVSSPPELTPSEIMRRIKGRTASKLFEEFPHLKKNTGADTLFLQGDDKPDLISTRISR
jgi:putative transposase